MSNHYVYIIECNNGSFYTGYTTDIERRYSEHVKGTPKCKYTRAFPPKRLAACWEFADKSEALSMENQIKSMSKQEKIELVAKFRCTLDNPDLPIEFIKETLISKNTEKSLAEPFNFEDE